MTKTTDLERIFHAAREVPAGSERDAFLRDSCGGNEALYTQVKKLLGADADVDDVFGGSEPVIQRPEEAEGTMVGRYKLLQQIGEGGFGVVWMAEQQEPVSRKVALKIIKLGMDTKQVVARFEAERQALAMLDHPNIAKVLDGGATDSGRPCFVMELIRGVPITAYCDRAKLGPKERLELFQSVCQAIQHAHQKGIIHRDIKPNNVIVTLHDGEPVTKVIDFGIAKATEQRLTERTMFTKFEQMIGTPEYISPEQADLSRLDVDTRSDIYSLGVLLYELLTGTKPFDAATLLEHGYAEMVRVIRDVDPEKPSTRLSTNTVTALDVADKRHMPPQQLSKTVRGELDWIVMKCLEKDRSRRYDTATGLAVDIGHYLADEPVAAGAPSASYKLRKMMCRNRGKVVAVSAVAGVLLIGIAGTSLGWIRARDSESRASTQLARATIVKDLISDMLTSVSPEELQWRGYDTALLKKTLSDTSGQLAEIEDELVRAEMHDLVGRAFRDLYDNKDASTHLQAAFEIRERLLGEDAEDTLGTKLSLARITGTNGDYAGAMAMVKDVLERAERTLGESHRTTMFAMKSYATCLRVLGNPDEAEPITRRALALQRKHLGEDDPETLFSMEDLTQIHAARAERADYRRLLSELLAARRRVHGDDYPLTVRSISAMVDVELDHDRLEEALSLADEAVGLVANRLEGHHQSVLISRYTRARVHVRLGQFEEAGAELRDVLALYDQFYSERNLTRIAPRVIYAEALIAQGRFVEAAPLLDELADSFPPAIRLNGGRLALEIMHANALIGRGQFHRAQALSARLQPLIDEAHPSHPPHRRKVRAYCTCVISAASAGDVEEVRGLAQKVRSMLLESLNDPDPNSATHFRAAQAILALATAAPSSNRAADLELALKHAALAADT